MKVYKYGEIIIPETKLEQKLKKYGITINDLVEYVDTADSFVKAEDEYPYTYRVSVNTVLCAYNVEDLENLKKRWKNKN